VSAPTPEQTAALRELIRAEDESFMRYWRNTLDLILPFSLEQRPKVKKSKKRKARKK